MRIRPPRVRRRQRTETRHHARETFRPVAGTKRLSIRRDALNEEFGWGFVGHVRYLGGGTLAPSAAASEMRVTGLRPAPSREYSPKDKERSCAHPDRHHAASRSSNLQRIAGRRTGSLSSVVPERKLRDYSLARVFPHRTQGASHVSWPRCKAVTMPQRLPLPSVSHDTRATRQISQNPLCCIDLPPTAAASPAHPAVLRPDPAPLSFHDLPDHTPLPAVQGFLS
jgi:hypothetical protein